MDQSSGVQTRRQRAAAEARETHRWPEAQLNADHLDTPIRRHERSSVEHSDGAGDFPFGNSDVMSIMSLEKGHSARRDRSSDLSVHELRAPSYNGSPQRIRPSRETYWDNPVSNTRSPQKTFPSTKASWDRLVRDNKSPRTAFPPREAYWDFNVQSNQVKARDSMMAPPDGRRPFDDHRTFSRYVDRRVHLDDHRPSYRYVEERERPYSRYEEHQRHFDHPRQSRHREDENVKITLPISKQ